MKKCPKMIKKRAQNETRGVQKRTPKNTTKKIAKLLKNDAKMAPILIPKATKKEQIRTPKWDPVQKTPKGGQMEPKCFKMDPKWNPKST